MSKLKTILVHIALLPLYLDIALIAVALLIIIVVGGIIDWLIKTLDQLIPLDNLKSEEGE